MSYLVRKISRAKWPSEEEIAVLADDMASISADAITSCLRTSSNQLSAWSIETLDDIDTAILALATGSKQTKINTMHIIFFETEKLKEFDIDFISTPGDTVIDQYKNLHKDIDKITYETLGNLSSIIIESLKENRYRLISKSTLTNQIKAGISSSIINKENLHEDLITELKL